MMLTVFLIPLAVAELIDPSLVARMASAAGASEGLKRIHFEVFGLVQGVFFRKSTQSQAREYNLVGWVRNNRSGTVEGEAEGAALQINAL
ncbi:hypothetical protein ACTXT7_015827 [Hymenolepis weldensis]